VTDRKNTTGSKSFPPLNWTNIQEDLGTLEADVLMILNCCCAGNAARSAGVLSRNMEIIAAASEHDPTGLAQDLWLETKGEKRS
jgi:hypothetical protein